MPRHVNRDGTLSSSCRLATTMLARLKLDRPPTATLLRSAPRSRPFSTSTSGRSAGNSVTYAAEWETSDIQFLK